MAESLDEAGFDLWRDEEVGDEETGPAERADERSEAGGHVHAGEDQPHGRCNAKQVEKGDGGIGDHVRRETPIACIEEIVEDERKQDEDGVDGDFTIDQGSEARVGDEVGLKCVAAEAGKKPGEDRVQAENGTDDEADGDNDEPSRHGGLAGLQTACGCALA